MFSPMAANGKEMRVNFLVELPLTRRCATEAIAASLWRCEPFLELARNTVARTNGEAGKSGPTFEVSE